MTQEGIGCAPSRQWKLVYFEGILGGNFFEHHVVCLDYKLREIESAEGKMA